VKQIYSSHFFEHLTFNQGQKMLKECLRVQVPGGALSVCVPNARLYIEAYCSGKGLDHETFIEWAPAWNSTTKMEYVNYTVYMDGDHQYMFDEENLLAVFSKAGFRNARPREFDASLDRQERDYESIYAVAEK
jgi:predicted SAM-dependent methyltransferase